MTLDAQWVAYGRAAAEALHARIAVAKGHDPLQPVTIVVPTNYVGVSMRRLLASGTLGPITAAGAGLAGVTLLTVYRLAELLGAPPLAAAARRPVSTPVIAAAVRGALRDAPGRFAPVADHPSTERALVRAHAELSDVSEAGLRRLAATSERAADVVRIHRAVRAALAGDWYGERDLMVAATGAVDAGAPVLADLGTVVVHLPQDLSHPAAALLRAVAERTRVEVIAGTTGVPSADRDVDRTLRRLGVSGPPKPDAPPPPVTEVVSVSDAEEEVRAAVRRVMAALHDDVPLERMALVYPHAEPYARLAHEQLLAAGIRYNGGAVRPLTDRLVGRWLLDALRLRERDLQRQDVLDLLATAPVRTRSGRRVPAAAWERVSRDAGVVRGRADWDRRLAGLAQRCDVEADQVAAADDGRDWLVDRLHRVAGDARGLRGFVLDLARRLDEGAGARSWVELTAWARGLVTHYLGGEGDRGNWPDAERRAADKVDGALDRLAVLDAVEEDASPATFRRTLKLELESDLDRVGRFGEGLLVGGLSAALGVDLDVVIVLGCAEGVLPNRVREDSLLPDSERAEVADELPLRADRVHVEHRHLLAALAAGGSRQVLMHPRGDLRRSLERPPSRWLLDAVAALPRTPGDETDGARVLPRDARWLTRSPSFAAGVATAALPATRQEYALRALSRHRRTGARLESHPLAVGDPALARGLALLRGRRSDGFTRYDGDLSQLAGLVPAPTAADAVTSPTRLEAWAKCPHRYLMEHVLRVGVVENPEELLEISALDRGNLVHEALEAWLEDRLAQALPDPDSPWSAQDRAALARIAVSHCDRYEQQGLTGHPLLWGRDRARLLVDFDRFLDHDDARRATQATRPLAAEVPFGLDGTEPVSVPLGGGRSVRLRGKIDRLDATDAGALVVTDYKTGSRHDTERLSADDPVLAGTKLQLPVYALAVRARQGDPAAPVRAEYWFVTTKGEFKAVGYDVDGAILDAFRHALTVIVDGIQEGLFPARPAEPGWRPFIDCDYCDPDGLGTTDRWRDWERKRLTSHLRDYVALVEPEVLDGVETAPSVEARA